MKVTSGILSLVAGGGTNWVSQAVIAYSPDTAIAATSASVATYGGIAVRDPDLFMQGKHIVSRIDIPTGQLKRYFGTSVGGSAGVGGASGDGGPATSATVANPQFMFADTIGGLYVVTQGCPGVSCTYTHDIIRYVNADNIVSTFAGMASTAATISANPSGVAATSVRILARDISGDTAGNLYVTGFSKVSKIGVDKIIQDYAGVPSVGTTPTYGNPVPASATAMSSIFLTVNPDTGDVFYGSHNSPDNNIYKVSKSNMTVSQFAGQTTQVSSGDGGPASSASMYLPFGMAVDNTRQKLYWVERADLRYAYLN